MNRNDDLNRTEKFAFATVVTIVGSLAGIEIGLVPSAVLPLVAIGGIGALGLIALANVASGEPWNVVYGASVLTIFAAIGIDQVPAEAALVALAAIIVVGVRERVRFLGGTGR